MIKLHVIFIACCLMTAFVSRTGSACEDSWGISVDDFLKTADRDLKVENHNELLRYMENRTEDTPYLDKVEFRTETEEFDLEKQKYAVRFYPKGIGETRYLKKLSGLVSDAALSESETYYTKALKSRYDTILQYMLLSSYIEYYQKLWVLYDDKINVLRKKCSNDLPSYINELIRAEDQQVDIQLAKIKYEHQYAALLRQVRSLSGKDGGICIDEKDMVKNAQISLLVSDLKEDDCIQNVYMKNRALKKELSYIKYRVEVSKNQDYLSYFQVAYKSEDRDDPEKAVSLELGVKLPFIHSGCEDLEQKKIKLLKSKLGFEEEKEKYTEKISSASLLLRRLISQRLTLSQRKEHGDAEVSYRAYLNVDGVDPLDLLKIKESILKNEIELVEIDNRIRESYIELLEITGHLSQKPLKNYLSSYLEPIE